MPPWDTSALGGPVRLRTPRQPPSTRPPSVRPSAALQRALVTPSWASIRCPFATIIPLVVPDLADRSHIDAWQGMRLVVWSGLTPFTESDQHHLHPVRYRQPLARTLTGLAAPIRLNSHTWRKQPDGRPSPPVTAGPSSRLSASHTRRSGLMASAVCEHPRARRYQPHPSSTVIHRRLDRLGLGPTQGNPADSSPSKGSSEPS